MDHVLKHLRQIGIIPVVVLDDPGEAVALAKTLCQGGLPCAEVTFRTCAAEEAIYRMTKAFPQMLVGAGTVLTRQQADRAIDAGAQFVVSPGFNPKVTQHVLDRGICMTPGVCTPTELEAALELGLSTVKFFPAQLSGGVNMIRALSAPYTGVQFIPTGGINEQNVKEYLSLERVLACGGSWMVPKDLIRRRDYDQILRLVQTAAELVKEVRGKWQE